MERLARKYKVTVTTWLLANEDRVRLATSITGESDVHIQMREGQRLPSLLGATGRILVGYAGLTEEELRHKFVRLRWQAAPAFQAYMEQSKQAKRRGYAIDDGNYARGVLTVAAPVLNSDDDLSLIVAATMFSGQHGPSTLHEIGAALSNLGNARGRKI